MRLKLVETKILKPKPPFNFDPTFFKPAHFPSTDRWWEPGSRWQTWFWQGQAMGLRFKNLGTIDRPEIKVQIFGQKKPETAFIQSLFAEIRFRYNLDYDLADFYRFFGSDSVLKPLIQKWNGMRPGHQNSLYEYLIVGVVLQNATVRRSVSMLQTLFEQYGKLLQYDGKKLYCFWKPGGLRNVSEQDLRSLKIGYRAKFIKKIDDQFYEHKIDEMVLRRHTLEEQKEALLNLYGVGPATVGYILFDVFHRWDFFDHISPWEQKIYSKIFFDKESVSVDKLLKYFNRYGTYKQLAVNYVWENIWWKRKNESLPWLEKLIRL